MLKKSLINLVGFLMFALLVSSCDVYVHNTNDDENTNTNTNNNNTPDPDPALLDLEGTPRISIGEALLEVAVLDDSSPLVDTASPIQVLLSEVYSLSDASAAAVATPVTNTTPPPYVNATTGEEASVTDITDLDSEIEILLSYDGSEALDDCVIKGTEIAVDCEIGYTATRGQIAAIGHTFNFIVSVGAEGYNSKDSNTLVATRHVITQISNTNDGGADDVASPTVCGDSLFFIAKSPEFNTTLFKYDGSNLTRLQGITYASASGNILSLNDKLYVVAFNGSYTKLFEYNPANNSLTQVSDINVGGTDVISGLTSYDGEVYFSASPNGNPTITKLYKYNPADQTTTKVSNINAAGSDTPTYLTVFNGELYFKAIKTGSTDKIYKYNSDSGAVTQVSSIAPVAANPDGVSYLTVFNGDLYFSAGGKLFKYNPTTENKTVRVSNINGTEGTGSGPDTPMYLTVLNGELYFSANKSTASGTINKLYKYNPTDNKITQISNIHADGADTPQNLTAFNGELYFSAIDETGFTKLYKYNPTDNQIVKISDMISGGSDTIAYMTVFNGALYFSGVKQVVDLLPHTKLYKYE